MSFAVYLALFMPLLGFLGLVIFHSKIEKRWGGIIGCSTILISFLAFIYLLIRHVHGGAQFHDFVLYHWIPLKGIEADFKLHIDSLSLLLGLIVTGIGFLIHVYSIGYMEHDEEVVRYFAFLNFFVFSMLLLILAGHLLLLFVGWEGVGLASYLLIGFWYTRPSAAQAATKAFIINRIGDLGFLLGLLLTFYLFQTGDIQQISERASQEFPIGAPIITVMTLLYFFGATGKSAQIPLHTWLPDAMEGPTPVSALIHAATMVTAGVYLIVRMSAVFILAPITLQVIGIVGALTSLYAALSAIGQTDLKRVLAYSTISQLGFMFLACGAAAFYSAIFHLTSHAFIKALLFLSAGNVIHMLHDTTEMGQMGGLAKPFKTTHLLFLIGVLSLAGIPPFAAFFSKDLILEQEFMSGYEVLFYIGLASSILTGFYLMRAYCLTFLGKSAVKKEEFKNLRDAPRVMLVPVKILTILSMVGGLLGFTYCFHPLLEEFLSQIPLTEAEKKLNSGFIITSETWIAILGAFSGVGLAALLYTRYVGNLGSPIQFLRKAFYFDALYEMSIEKPTKAISRTISSVLEPGLFDQMIKEINKMTQYISSYLQQLQSGQIRSYIAWMVIGSVFLLVYLVL